MTQPISCALHDHLEVACLYGYQMRLTLVSGNVLRGRAVTTDTRSDKTEVLVLSIDNGNHDVAMDQIARIEIETEAAMFQSLEFPR